MSVNNIWHQITGRSPTSISSDPFIESGPDPFRASGVYVPTTGNPPLQGSSFNDLRRDATISPPPVLMEYGLDQLISDMKIWTGCQEALWHRQTTKVKRLLSKPTDLLGGDILMGRMIIASEPVATKITRITIPFTVQDVHRIFDVRHQNVETYIARAESLGLGLVEAVEYLKLHGFSMNEEMHDKVMAAHAMHIFE